MLTSQDMQMAEQRVQGITLEEIGKSHGLPLTTTHRKLNRPETKAYLETLQSNIINITLPEAVENIHHAIKSYRTTPKDDPQIRDHGFKASMKVMESAGLLPGNQQSIYIQQVYNDNRSEMPNIVKDLFNRVTGNKQANLLDVIEDEVA